MNFDRTDYINHPIPIEHELKILFKQKRELTIFEIGACEGEDSVKYARFFPNSKIYCFEPLPNNVKLIHANFLRYNIKNAACYNKAISSENGTAEFYVSTGQPPNAIESDWDYGNKSSSLLAPAKHLEIVDFIHFETKIVVETITLKSFCRANNINSIDFMHMDVQGAELMVLSGAGDFISFVKAIWLEVSKINFYKDQPLEDDVKRFMTQNNFVLIKDALLGNQGDQLYISRNFYSPFIIRCIQFSLFIKSISRRGIQKFRFSG